MVALGERGREMCADGGAQMRTRREDRVGVDVAADLTRNVGFTRRGQGLRHEGGLELGVGEDRRERIEQARIVACRPARAQRRHIVDQ
jgi:hypothetical protein